MSSSTSGFVVVRRLNFFDEIPVGNPIPRKADRLPSVSLSHDEIRRRYRGVDGWPWPEVPGVELLRLGRGLVEADQYDSVKRYFDIASRTFICDLVFIQFGRAVSSVSVLPTEFRFLGYDYGYYLSEEGVYSSLLHEVIYGVNQQLRGFATSLNEHLLFSHLDVVRFLESTRNSLMRGGADLEGDESCLPMAIYGVPG
jgi:hypothetical protein